MGGVQWLGESLGKPVAAVEGTLSGLTGGDWGGGLLNLIPGSDTVGWTDPAKRISGSDLLEHWGVLPPKDHAGFDPTDYRDWVHGALGFGLDVALDPLMWTGIGTLTKAGKAAEESAKVIEKMSFAEKAALSAKGELPGATARTTRNLAEQFGGGERALLNVHAPFWAQWMGASKDPIASIGTGENVEKAMKWINSSSPLRFTKGLFSPSSAGKKIETSELGQLINDLNTGEYKNLKGSWMNLMTAGMAEDKSLFQTYSDIAQDFGARGDTDSYNAFLQQIAERYGGIPKPEEVAKSLQELFDLPAGSPQAALNKTATLADAMHSYADSWVTAIDAGRNRVNDLGGAIPELADVESAHGTGRRSGAAAAEGTLNKMMTRLFRGKGLPEGMMDPAIVRNDILRNVPGGTGTINRLAKDPLFMGFQEENGLHTAMNAKDQVQALQEFLGSKEKSLANLREEYAKNIIKGEMDDRLLRDPEYGTGITVAGKDGKDVTFNHGTQEADWIKGKRTGELMDFLDGMAPQKTTERWNKVLDKVGADTDLGKGVQSYLDNIKATGGIWSKGIFDQSFVQNASDYMKYIAHSEATMRTMHKFLAEPGLVGDAEKMVDGLPLAEVWKAAGLKDAGLKTWLMNNHKEEFDALLQAGKLPDEAATELASKLHADPRTAGALKAYREVTSPRVQNGLLEMWDKASGIYKQGLYSVWPQSHFRDLLSHTFNNWSDGKVNLLGENGLIGEMKDAMKYAAAEGAEHHQYFDEFTKLEGLKGNELTEVLGEAAAKPWEKMPEGGFLKTLKSDIPEKLGGGGGWGKNIQGWQNFVNRGGYYSALRKKGFSAAEAMEAMKRSGFDYSEMSSFERNVMKRVIPFYSFLRKNVPYQLSNLISEPGGRTALTLRAMSEGSSAHQEGVYTPDFMRESTAFPFGGTPDAQSFLKSTIVPFGDLNDLVFRDGKPQLGRSAEKLASRANPLLLLPTEMATGKQMSTGRNIADLESPTKSILGTAIAPLDRAIHYSPVSRVEGFGWMLGDARKAWWQKMLTTSGMATVSTYPTDKWKLIDLREEIARRLEAQPEIKSWKNYYLPTFEKDKMAPDEVRADEGAMKRREQLTQRLSQYAKQQRAKKQAQGVQ